MRKPLPETGAVNLCRLVQIIGNGLQACQQGNHHKGEGFPRARPDDCKARNGLVRKKQNRFIYNVQLLQHIVYETKLVVQHPLPSGCSDLSRNNPGNQDQSAEQSAELDIPVQQHREYQSHDIRDDDNRQRIGEGKAQHTPEFLITGEEPYIIVYAVKANLIRLQQVVVHEGHHDATNQRIYADQADQQCGREKHLVSQRLIV